MKNLIHCEHNDKFIEKLWNRFGNVPITNDDLIDTKFYIWEKGTDRIEVIWRWFDRNYSKGVIGLLKGNRYEI